MSVVGDLRAALRQNVKDNLGGIQVSRYFLPNPTPPVIHMWPSADVTYHDAMQKGMVTFTFTVQAVVDWTEDGASQMMLDKFYDTSGEDSVIAAVESDRTLGGLAEEVQVTSAGPYEVLLAQDNTARLTVDWTVKVWVNGST